MKNGPVIVLLKGSEKKMERICLSLLSTCTRSAVYLGTIVASIYASSVITTSIYLACVLTNVYATAVIVVMSSC
jgi:hypothetical protein